MRMTKMLVLDGGGLYRVQFVLVFLFLASLCFVQGACARELGDTLTTTPKMEQPWQVQLGMDESDQELWLRVYASYLEVLKGEPMGIGLENTAMHSSTDIANELDRREQNWVQLGHRWGAQGVSIEEFVSIFDQNASKEVAWKSSCILVSQEAWLSTFIRDRMDSNRHEQIERRIREELEQVQVMIDEIDAGGDIDLVSPGLNEIDYLPLVAGRIVYEELLRSEPIWQYVEGFGGGDLQRLFFIVRVRNDPFLLMNRAKFVAEERVTGRTEPDFVGVRVSLIPGRDNSEWCRYYYLVFSSRCNAETFVQSAGRLLWWASDTEMIVFQFLPTETSP